MNRKLELIWLITGSREMKWDDEDSFSIIFREKNSIGKDDLTTKATLTLSIKKHLFYVNKFWSLLNFFLKNYLKNFKVKIVEILTSKPSKFKPLNSSWASTEFSHFKINNK